MTGVENVTEPALQICVRALTWCHIGRDAGCGQLGATAWVSGP